VDTDSLVMFLVVGVILVAVDGFIIYRSGRRYLGDAYADSGASSSMNRLITVLFYLVSLGVLALLSIVEIGGNSVQAVVARLGVLLLVLALAHAITVAVLTRIRENQDFETVNTRRSAAAAAPYQDPTRLSMAEDPVVSPVPGQQGRDPQVSPGIEQRQDRL
jgi:protein-S-isoprenylcysteine O-methyltransferase Ste14